MVASTGGHLEQLVRLRARIGDSMGPVEWATFDGAQSRDLLRGEVVHHVDYIKPRDLAAAAKDFPPALRILANGGYHAVVSTGSAIAVPFFLAAGVLGISRYYIESAARADGPSLSGRIVSHIPGTRLFTQYEEWAGGPWTYIGSLFDAFRPGASEDSSLAPDRAPGRVVVTLGTMPTYGFRRAVERLSETLPDVVAPDAEILWQTGATDLSGLPLNGRSQVPAAELGEAIRDADLVVTHGGIGSALMALEAGRVPVMLPRLSAFAEHVDDHQLLICNHLGSRGIAVSRDADELTPADLWRAAHSSTTKAPLASLNLDLPQPRRRRDLVGASAGA